MWILVLASLGVVENVALRTGSQAHIAPCWAEPCLLFLSAYALPTIRARKMHRCSSVSHVHRPKAGPSAVSWQLFYKCGNNTVGKGVRSRQEAMWLLPPRGLLHTWTPVLCSYTLLPLACTSLASLASGTKTQPALGYLHPYRSCRAMSTSILGFM